MDACSAGFHRRVFVSSTVVVGSPRNGFILVHTTIAFCATCKREL